MIPTGSFQHYRDTTDWLRLLLPVLLLSLFMMFFFMDPLCAEAPGNFDNTFIKENADLLEEVPLSTEAHVDADEITIAEYISQLEQMPSSINTPGGMERLEKFILKPHRIRQNESSVVSIDNSQLKPLLTAVKEGKPGSMEKMQSYLRGMSYQASTFNSARFGSFDPSEVRSSLTRILSDRAFRGRGNITFYEIMDRIGRWLDKKTEEIAQKMDFLDPLQKFLGMTEKLSSGFFKIIYYALGVILIIILAYLIFKSMKLKNSELVRKKNKEEKILTAEQIFREARLTAERGDYRAAFRLIFISLLVLLDKKDVLEYNRNMTNWEIVRNISPDAGYKPSLEKFSGLFDRIWYGMEPAGADDLEKGEALYREVLSLC